MFANVSLGKWARVGRITIAAALALVVLAACEEQQGGGGMMPAGGPVEVSVVTLQEQRVELSNQLPGRAVAYRKAQVRPQVSGIIEKRLFTEGAEVEMGEQLYQIDPARYEAAAANARAQLQRAQANLSTAQARETRYKNLIKEKAVSQQEYDDALATFEQAQADVAVSQAALQTAEIDLRYTKVKAPVSGRIGVSSVTEGALVSAGQSQVLATIHQMDPIYIDVSQPAKRILQMRRQLMQGKISQSESPGVRLILDDGSVYEHEGQLQFSDMSVNETTGTVVVRALFPNPDSLILPGMFIRAEVNEGVHDNAVLVPQRGVTRDREGNATALVVNESSEIESRTVVASRAVGSQWLVESGLAAGDRVVVAGLQKIKPGAKVNAVEVGTQGE
ncbi:efflux RND transporter periplasmic adaptor subunit [Gilvimarinus sp. SDUM040013]|uniref:Efflux RND transporter periplasmic adaptor subunit n=1 Tax=Gilvimarinus gilvus TaxID=3058038 RepID=A0ABU4RWE3_9GAMM|nr:efflux RND transporter periplasmic adaptor subunit [Gilvimarinus sp. SDUM040013]MDO3385210.1 efflux RND transporter periplasmic adaptor subunit [Gilvimarinus sp. SDUM040013]MDX6849193.1 efflux RND transporter periplasmic adaptor subunit [Gilvimarinus sp. SDUM040013]